jgi:hypothetical protein
VPSLSKSGRRPWKRRTVERAGNEPGQVDAGTAGQLPCLGAKEHREPFLRGALAGRLSAWPGYLRRVSCRACGAGAPSYRERQRRNNGPPPGRSSTNEPGHGSTVACSRPGSCPLYLRAGVVVDGSGACCRVHLFGFGAGGRRRGCRTSYRSGEGLRGLAGPDGGGDAVHRDDQARIRTGRMWLCCRMTRPPRR